MNLHPSKKLNKREIKLKSKPWISKEILFLMWKRDKLFSKYYKCKNPINKPNLFSQYKVIRNDVTKLKRDNKIKHYKNFFEVNKKKTSAIWKGIRSLVTMKSSNLNVITIIDKNGSLVTDPIIIANSFNEYFANVGPSIENKISVSRYIYSDYLKDVGINHSFYLKPAMYDEVAEIIQSLDINKSLGPNSLPIYIFEDFLSTCLLKIANLSFRTGIFPDLCKIAKVIPIFKKDDHLLCQNYRPISLLPIYSKMFEKLLYTRMYSFLEKNKLLNQNQFGFRQNHSTSHALINLTETIKRQLDEKNLWLEFSLI